MSCAHPWLMKTKKYNAFTHDFYTYIPCGRCLNCRVDKQNELTHRCEWELINYKCGAFVTLTYDDLHIVDKLRYNKAGELVATISKDDLKKYLYRLRKNIQRRMPDNLLCNHHFKFLAVSEYGGDGQLFDRPHIHLLFFGLDFAYCKRELERAWQGRGITKILPILDGGIRYVLKYLDKQLFGDLAKMKYDENNLEQPFQTHSIGLGSDLYKSQLSHINTHNGTYRWKGHDVPIPPYYKNKFYTKAANQFTNYENIKYAFKVINGFDKNPKFYDLHDYSIRKNLLREKNINNSNFLHGRPRFDLPQFQNSFYANQYIQDLTYQALNASIPF